MTIFLACTIFYVVMAVVVGWKIYDKKTLAEYHKELKYFQGAKFALNRYMRQYGTSSLEETALARAEALSMAAFEATLLAWIWPIAVLWLIRPRINIETTASKLVKAKIEHEKNRSDMLALLEQAKQLGLDTSAMEAIIKEK